MTTQHRRSLLRRSLEGLAFASSLLSLGAGAVPLDPATIPHFKDPLPKHGGMPQATKPAGFTGDYYEIAVRQTTQQILPTGFPQTTIWAFGPAANSVNSGFFTPAAAIVGRPDTPVRVKWINDLVDHTTGTFITYPPSVPVDQGKHWANPTGICDGGGPPPDCQGQGSAGPYTGPVPIIVHLHGSHTFSSSDGIPEAWWLPAGAGNVEPFTRGSDWSQGGNPMEPVPPVVDGAAYFDYPNHQPPTTMFFHDHTLGITAQNVLMGLAGPYVLAGGPNDLPAGQLPSGLEVYEWPLVIQDRAFNTDGSFVGVDDGNTFVVNGKVWPYLNVEPRKYRFRIVAATNSIFLNLSFANTGRTGLRFTQIGNDGGFLPKPVVLRSLALRPGERADVVVDFSAFAGKSVVLASDGDVMQFNVVRPLSGPDNTPDPTTLTLIPPTPLCPVVGGVETACETNTRNVSVLGTALGTVTGSPPKAVTMLWDAPTTENAPLNSTEVWNIYNFGGEPHPIHLHEVSFEVLGRSALDGTSPTPPAPGELGRKDTVLSKGYSIVKVRANFDIGGLFAWHCHMTSHEDDEMMRPMCVVDSAHPCNAH